MHLDTTLARPWVQAKDVILELLRRLSVSAAREKSKQHRAKDAEEGTRKVFSPNVCCHGFPRITMRNKNFKLKIAGVPSAHANARAARISQPRPVSA